MSLLETELSEGRTWTRLDQFYEITRKPRGANGNGSREVPFVAMEAVPQSGDFSPRFDHRPESDIKSGTYFERGDVLVAKITPSFENGKQAYVRDLPSRFGYATTEVIPLRPRAEGHDPRFVFYYLLHPDVRSFVAERMEGTTGRKRVPEEVLLSLPLPDLPEKDQINIADALQRVREAIANEVSCAEASVALKRAAMRELFTRGLCGEAQKETDIGLVPESWAVGRLDKYATVVSTRMSYSELEALEPSEEGDTIRVLGIKVADMNLPGNEIELTTAALEKLVAHETAEYRCAPPRTIIFPKRGAAIATNKKRISREWTAFDPNMIGVVGGSELDQDFLFHWFQTFDLRTITEPGPTPQLNKKNLEPLTIPVPPLLQEQGEIVAILDAIDRKIALHRRKKAILEELFKALLHKLMTGEIRVADLDLSALRTPNDSLESAERSEEVI